MENPRDRLNQVWSEFRKVGVADDLAIIGRIAALLLDLTGHAMDNERDYLYSRVPTDTKLDNPKIQEALTEAIRLAGGADKLFDRHLLFRLATILPGGRYPTPRHIVDHLLRLAPLQPTQTLADFACGSGGFLVHRQDSDGLTAEQTYGIDISPEWARFAVANTRLHNIPATIEPINVLQLPSPEQQNAQFDRIFMNPPFGEKVDAKLAKNVVGYAVGSRSETVFTALALKHLAPKGTAAILVPSGFLFSNSSGDRTLRQKLVEDHQLEAIVSFPKDTLQPYSSLQTHLLLLHKDSPSPNHLTWFLQAEQDGYPAGRSRDLTEPPPNLSDLPTVEQILLSSVKAPNGFDEPLLLKYPQVGIKKIWVGDRLAAITFHGITADLVSISLNPPPKPKKGEKGETFPLLTIEVATEQRTLLSIPLYDIPGLELTVSSNLSLLSQTANVAVIALPLERLTDPVRLLGVAVQSSVIQQQAYDLRPEQYIGKQQESRSSDNPAVILGRIYRNQRSLAQRIDRLFGHLEMPPIATLELPSPPLGDEPFGQLSQEQQKIWEKIREETDKTTDNEATKIYFAAKGINPTDTDEVTDVTRQTLNLFERMGLIVPVTILDPDTNQPQSVYRYVAERDLWQQSDSGESSSEEEST